MRRIAIIALLVVAAVVVAVNLRYSGKAPAAEGCDPALWPHVYRPKRLRVLTQCTAIEGRVTGVYRNEDGDAHIALDPDDAAVLNLVNFLHGGARLPIEAICDHESTQADVKAACAGYTSRIALPAIGERIRATGAYVKDRENGWNEVHPVSRIERLP